MNVAAFVATPIVDILRLQTPGGEVFLLPPYALLIAATGVAQLPVLFIAVFWLRDVNMDDDDEMVRPFVSPTAALSVRERVRGVVTQPDFWRAIVIVSCLIGVKSSFRYFDALYLPYVMRAYQDADTFPYLTLLALNPIIVIATTLTGVITILTGRITPVTAMIIGSFIGGMAPFWMSVGPYVWAIVMYIVWTSVGEIIWSPSSYAYLVSLTGDGDEGAWMALAGMPTFLAKVLTGTLTGGLLSAFCPDPRTVCVVPQPAVAPPGCFYRNGTAPPPLPPPPQFGGTPGRCNAIGIWGIIGSTTITSCIALIVLRGYIDRPSEAATETIALEEEEVEAEDIPLTGK